MEVGVMDWLTENFWPLVGGMFCMCLPWVVVVAALVVLFVLLVKYLSRRRD
jgi:hypothetical protein